MHVCFLLLRGEVSGGTLCILVCVINILKFKIISVRSRQCLMFHD